MIVKKKNQMYKSQRTMIRGSGFVDTLNTFGTYLYQNKDLIAKPLISAVSDVGGIAIREGGRKIIKKLLEKKTEPVLSSESKNILSQMKSGSGIKRI